MTGPARSGDVPRLKALWQSAFGDDPAVIDQFFQSLFRPDSTVVCWDGDDAVAMAHWLPMTVCRDGKGWPIAYVYAVATDEAHRGRGYCRDMLEYFARTLPEQGVRGLVLVPGSDSLRQLYRRYGFSDYTAVSLQTLDAGSAAGTWEAIEPPEYLMLREELLAHTAYVSCSVPILSFQRDLAAHYSGGLYRLESNGVTGVGCGAVDGDGEGVVYELLWPGDGQAGADLMAAALGVSRLLVRTPGEGTPFAMARWLTEMPPAASPYLGLALD